jgi:DNA excision repair protein ERCC-2
MDNLSKIKVSVRDLIEFVLRQGDLVSSFAGSSRNTDAIKAHQKIQKSSGDNYNKEVTISHTVIKDNISLEINGRIDGVITEKQGVIIDEIKTTTNELDNITEDYNILHWAQVKCYAYFYSLENNLKVIDARLTYYQMNTKKIKYFVKTYSLIELEKFFNYIIEKYIYWAKLQQRWEKLRNLSIKDLSFPYEEYRMGQRKLLVAVYISIKENKNFFVKAPTGIGKTISTIFPAVKALGEGIISKIFYATAKTTTGNEAKKAVILLDKKKLKFKTVWITAKEKICFKEETNCDPEICEYARGHFDRINNAIASILNENIITREVIESYAKKYNVCPFEFSLDLSNWCDCVVCDYNYIFDPKVYLRRFFSEDRGNYCVLVDEAHNLIDRARDMYSAELNKKDILNLKNKCKEISSVLYKNLNKINKFFIKERKKCEENKDGIYLQKDPPKDIMPLLKNYIYEAEKFLVENNECNVKEEILDVYFKINSFIRIYESYSDKYVTYSEKVKDDILIKMFCVDTSEVMRACLKKVKSTILFSATLTPMNYFINLLGGDDDSYKISLPSPFKRENLCLLLNDSISTKYKYRQFTYKKVVSTIKNCISQKSGNYFVFFPSYEYMKSIFYIFNDENEENEKINIVCQKNTMTEEEKNDFIKKFSENVNETLIGFVVMGGVFSEGIDLIGKKLIGAIIVGVGIPRICLERNIIKEYFVKSKVDGFLYSYVYPGINKVLQSAGRVIRTDKDRGIVVLIDERYSQSEYKKLLPNEWSNIKKMNNSTNESSRIIFNFWNEKQ